MTAFFAPIVPNLVSVKSPLHSSVSGAGLCVWVEREPRHSRGRVSVGNASLPLELELLNSELLAMGSMGIHASLLSISCRGSVIHAETSLDIAGSAVHDDNLIALLPGSRVRAAQISLGCAGCSVQLSGGAEVRVRRS